MITAIRKVYLIIKGITITIERKIRCSYRGRFINRSRNNENLCIILAGYKSFLYESVFDRVKRYTTSDIDICVVTAGLFSEEINRICEKNHWSYLSIKRNNVSQAQNVAIHLHPKAKYIFKLDEDIFITKDYFKNMLAAYDYAQHSKYNPGAIVPMLLVNGFSTVTILEEMNLISEYQKRFGTPLISSEMCNPILSNPEVAEFMWGKENVVPTIDELNSIFSKSSYSVEPVPIRFSIGAILFERSMWDEMNYFDVIHHYTHLGRDEIKIDTFAMLKSRPIMMSKNIVVGHLSFGPQNEEMKRYFKLHKEKFYAEE